MDFDTFREDPKTVAAVERKLLVISEAAIRFGDEAETRCPGLAWRDIRGIGNWLRHQYESIELPVVWKTVRDGASALRRTLRVCWRRIQRASLKPRQIIVEHNFYDLEARSTNASGNGWMS